MVLRILKGKEVGGYTSAIPVVYDDVANRIEQHFGIEVSANERGIIRDLFTVSTRRWTPEFQRTYQPTPEAARLTEELFCALGERFGTRPPLHLEKPCAALIEAGQTHMRYERAISLPQENTWTVQYENMASFMRLSEVLRDAPGLSGLNLYQTDVTRLAMLLLSYMDGLSSHDQWRVGLVVNCGIEQVFYARDRLERLIPCMRVARVLTETEVAEIESDPKHSSLDFLVSFDPIKTTLPLCVLSNAIDDADRSRIELLLMKLGCPHALDDAPLAGGLPERELDISHARMLTRTLHAALVEDGLWRGTLSGFSNTFEMLSFTHGPWLLLTVCSQDVAQTGAVHYRVETRVGFTGDRLQHILVLCVAPSDERVLTPATQRFRKLASEAGLKR